MSDINVSLSKFLIRIGSALDAAMGRRKKSDGKRETLEDVIDLETTLIFLKIEYDMLAILGGMIEESTETVAAEEMELLTESVKNLRDYIEGGVESLEANNIKLPDYCTETADGEIIEIVEGKRVSLNPYVIFRIGEPARVRKRTEYETIIDLLWREKPARARKRTNLFFLKMEYERLAALDLIIEGITEEVPAEVFEAEGINRAEMVKLLTESVKNLRDWIEGAVESLEAQNVKLPDYCVETADGGIEFLEVSDSKSSARGGEPAHRSEESKLGKSLLKTGLLLGAAFLFRPRNDIDR